MVSAVAVVHSVDHFNNIIQILFQIGVPLKRDFYQCIVHMPLWRNIY